MASFLVMDKTGVIRFDECISVYIEIFKADTLSKVMVATEKVLGGGHTSTGLSCILHSVYLTTYIDI